MLSHVSGPPMSNSDLTTGWFHDSMARSVAFHGSGDSLLRATSPSTKPLFESPMLLLLLNLSHGGVPLVYTYASPIFVFLILDMQQA